MATITMQNTPKNMALARLLGGSRHLGEGLSVKCMPDIIILEAKPRITIKRMEFLDIYAPHGVRDPLSDPKLQAEWNALVVSYGGHNIKPGSPWEIIVDDTPVPVQFSFRFDGHEQKSRAEELARDNGFSGLTDYFRWLLRMGEHYWTKELTAQHLLAGVPRIAVHHTEGGPNDRTTSP